MCITFSNKVFDTVSNLIDTLVKQSNSPLYLGRWDTLILRCISHSQTKGLTPPNAGFKLTMYQMGKRSPSGYWASTYLIH